MPNSELVDYPQHIEKRILIQADPGTVWDYLTNPERMKEWMGDPEMSIEILTDWKPGSEFVIRGFHHVTFENLGKILQFEPGRVFQYKYLSSMSNLEDVPNNYTIISFFLEAKGEQIELRVEANNFSTFEIYKHLEFYWNGTIYLLKQVIQNDKFKIQK